MPKKRKRAMDLVPEAVRKSSKRKEAYALAIEKPPRNIEQYKSILKEVKDRKAHLTANLKKAKSQSAREGIKEEIRFLDKVVLFAEKKVEAYSKNELEKKIEEKAREQEAERAKRFRKKPSKEETVSSLMELRKKLKEKRGN